MERYEVIPSVQWRRDDGMTASVYGACPWRSAAEKERWQRMQVGWTVRNTRDNTVGIGRLPWASREDAELWVAYRAHVRSCSHVCHTRDVVEAEGNNAPVVVSLDCTCAPEVQLMLAEVNRITVTKVGEPAEVNR